MPCRSESDRPVTALHATIWTGPRRANPCRRARTASRPTTQSRLRLGSIAASTTTASSPLSASLTGASINWPTSSVSFGRWAKRRRLTEPVASVTAPGSMVVTRSIGTKIRRLVASSTTMPSTRGGLASTRNVATRSRTLPMRSPSGPKTASPARRATKMRSVPTGKD